MPFASSPSYPEASLCTRIVFGFGFDATVFWHGCGCPLSFVAAWSVRSFVYVCATPPCGQLFRHKMRFQSVQNAFKTLPLVFSLRLLVPQRRRVFFPATRTSTERRCFRLQVIHTVKRTQQVLPLPVTSPETASFVVSFSLRHAGSACFRAVSFYGSQWRGGTCDRPLGIASIR